MFTWNVEFASFIHFSVIIRNFFVSEKYKRENGTLFILKVWYNHIKNGMERNRFKIYHARLKFWIFYMKKKNIHYIYYWHRFSEFSILNSNRHCSVLTYNNFQKIFVCSTQFVWLLKGSCVVFLLFSSFSAFFCVKKHNAINWSTDWK
jgi:hypothetical protein